MTTHLDDPIESRMPISACLFDHYYERVEICNDPFSKQAIPFRPLTGSPVVLQD